MRRDVQPQGEDAETGVYSFNFQISSSTGRQACSVKVQAQNFQDATQFIRQNWPIIETMAREELAKGCRHIESHRALMEIQHRVLRCSENGSTAFKRKEAAAEVEAAAFSQGRTREEAAPPGLGGN